MDGLSQKIVVNTSFVFFARQIQLSPCEAKFRFLILQINS